MRSSNSVQAAASLLALSILPLIRQYVHELFLCTHRASAFILLGALWHHIRLTKTLSRFLLIIIFVGLSASTIFQTIRQVYRNTVWNKHGGYIARVSNVRQYGDSLIVKIRLQRPWQVQLGNFVYPRVLTMKYGSIFQRHPFVITWWDERDETQEEESQDGQDRLKAVASQQNNKREALVLYIMIEPQNG